MTVRVGIERVLDGEATSLRSKRLGLIHHPASVTRTLRPSAAALLAGGLDLRVLFGPQHGARGEKQDNMVESADFRDSETGLPSYSLYGEYRRPTPEMLAGLDALLFDLQDVGVRVYTFIWTMALAMEACAEAGVVFVVLDRPNPIGGRREGPVLHQGYESFVGLHPIPLRHGLTVGELARWLNRERDIGCELEVVQCEGWARGMPWSDTGLPWVMPSPNLPTLESCAVYPGMVLLEGTNLSEGRGTTRPFELFGAPFVEPSALAEALQPLLGPGVVARPCHFEPTFQKHAGQVCGGAQLHVTDPAVFRPVHSAVAVLHAVRGLEPEEFGWREPPYEYEVEKAPIDILWGSPDLRLAIDAGRLGPDQIMEAGAAELAAWIASVQSDLLYG
jgi:uncharacterized protein YbbC (DUF1343 family)